MCHAVELLSCGSATTTIHVQQSSKMSYSVSQKDLLFISVITIVILNIAAYYVLLILSLYNFFALIYRIVVSAPNGTAPGGVIPNTGLIFTCPLQPGECEGLTGNRQGNDNRLFDTQSKVKCVKVKHHIQNFCRYLSIASFPGLPVYTLIPLAFTCRSSPPMYYCEWKVKIGKGWE